MPAPTVTKGQTVEYRAPRDAMQVDAEGNRRPIIRDAEVKFCLADPSRLILLVQFQVDPKTGKGYGKFSQVEDVPWNDSEEEFKPGTWRVKA